MKSKKITALLLVAAMTLGVIGCGSQGSKESSSSKESSQSSVESSASKESTAESSSTVVEEEPAADLSEHVDLTWYVSIGTSNDMEEVFAEANKIYEDKLNCNVEFNYLGSDYKTNMNLMIATQEEFDICYTDNWSLIYGDCVAQGGFLDITDMLPEVAPELWEYIPEAAWDACRINGRIYGIPNMQQWARRAGYLFNGKYYEEYDGKAVTDIASLADYIIRVSEGEKAKGNTWEYQADKNDWFYEFSQTVGWEVIGAKAIPGKATATEEHPTVFNEYLTDEFIEIIQAKGRLYSAGCIPSDILTTSTSYPSSNRIAVVANLGMSDEAEWQAGTFKDWEGVVMVPQGISMLTTDGISATMTAISATSKNPERALLAYQEMFFNTELYTLISYGIEDKHYILDDKGRVEKIPNAGYSGTNWKMGNTFTGLIPSNYNDLDRWERTIEFNNNAIPSSLLGFSYDTSKCSTEIANCQAVVNEYYNVFMAGAYGEDTMKYYDEFIKKLEAAGVDAVIADKQAQIDAFLAGK